MKEQEIWDEVKSLHEFIIYKYNSINTAKNYCSSVKQFLFHFSHISRPSDITAEMIIGYINKPEFETQTTKRNIHSAIKFYYKWKCGHKESKKFKYIPYPEKEDKLPLHVTKEDFIKIISVCDNIKHKCILMLPFDAGVRVSEIVNLRIIDIDSKLMQINVRQSKGRKDRKVKLSEIMLKYLRIYYKEHNPKDYLFEGQDGAKYSVRSCQQILHNCLVKAKLDKKYSIHKLRHGFAMALLENKTELDDIREYLGHNSIKTTRIYARMDNNMIQRNATPLEQILNQKAA